MGDASTFPSLWEPLPHGLCRHISSPALGVLLQQGFCHSLTHSCLEIPMQGLCSHVSSPLCTLGTGYVCLRKSVSVATSPPCFGDPEYGKGDVTILPPPPPCCLEIPIQQDLRSHLISPHFGDGKVYAATLGTPTQQVLNSHLHVAGIQYDKGCAATFPCRCLSHGSTAVR